MSKIKVIQGGVVCDDRGSLRFVNDFDPVTAGVRRFYQVQNIRSGYIRAWHGHLKEGKYVYVPQGSALIAAVQMKFNDVGFIVSDYYLSNEVQKWTLSSESPKVLYIPPGYANGFKTLTDDAILMFFSTSTLEQSKGDDIRFDYNILPNVWDEDFR